MFFSSFDEFRIMLLNIIKKQLEQNLLNEKKKFADKLNFEKTNISKSLKTIYSIVGKKYKEEDFLDQNHTINNNLFTACKTIASADSVKLIPPKYLESYNNNTTNQLYAISQSSNLRIRKVILRGAWWKDENGHLLAF